jgi:hypothetical protein
MESFTHILKKYESIDTSFGTDKNTSHSYGESYDIIFKEYKDSATEILEIGFDGGYSLLAYHDYFTNATIYGMDIHNNCRVNLSDKPRISVHFGDATLQENIEKFNTMYDIVIEDASHLPEHQIKHFVDFSKFVKPGGIYIIEDVHEKYIDIIRNILKPISEKTGFSMEVIDLREKKNRFDDIIIVFKKE